MDRLRPWLGSNPEEEETPLEEVQLAGKTMGDTRPMSKKRCSGDLLTTGAPPVKRKSRQKRKSRVLRRQRKKVEPLSVNGNEPLKPVVVRRSPRLAGRTAVT